MAGSGKRSEACRPIRIFLLLIEVLYCLLASKGAPFVSVTDQPIVFSSLSPQMSASERDLLGGSSMDILSLSLRRFATAAAIMTSLLLAGCQTDGPSAAKHLKPISPQMLSLLEQKQMSKEDPLVIRIFKEESELEVWKQDRSGRMALLKTYPICRWSGELGPKIREGDRQAPEGFYNITPGQMNPNSSLYLSFDLGYPNAFDRSYERTGSHLMVHGDCSSRGCYAMTDEQISEVYALAREAFFAGQKNFQVQAYPFRMTPKNLARHRSNPNMPFWKNLKEGYDHFEVVRSEPKVNVCERRYVFNARSSGNGTVIPPFDPAGKCPTYEVAPEVASAVAFKTNQDEKKIAELTKVGTPMAPIKTNTDGGMHSVFLAKVKSGVGSSDQVETRLSSVQSAPGTVPQHVNPPGEPKPVWASEPLTTLAGSKGLGQGQSKGKKSDSKTVGDANRSVAFATPPQDTKAFVSGASASPYPAGLAGAAPILPSSAFVTR